MLSDEIKREIEEKIRTSGTRQGACIEAMIVVQKHRGWVSDENIQDLAQFLDMAPDELDGVATFYNEIYRKPVGRHVILLCDSVVCWIMGYDGIRDYLTERLNITFGETTTDGRFTMLPIQCLGACDHGPAMTIDGELYYDLDPQKIDVILARYT